MSFDQIIGTSMITRMLFIGAMLIVSGDLIITVFTIFYQRFYYARYVRSKFNPSNTPRCAIIIPCKGIPKDLGKNLQGFLDLDYPDFSVVYSVESEHDEAVATIKKIVEKDSRARLAVAGLSTTCAQKNHNLLAGLKEAGTPDVYVFADADIRPEPGWLRELVMPLSDDKVAVTTGFRWLHARKGSLGELAHSYVNIFIYVLFSVACFFGGVGLWGGSMAIRRKDYEALGVSEKWAHAGVDDMSLSQLVFKAHRKAVFVTPCVVQTDDLIQTVGGTINWFERQIMYLKAYQKNLWLLLTPISLVALLLLFLMPFAAVSAISPHRTFFASGGGAAAFFYIGEIVTVLLYPLLGSMHSFRKFILFWPLLRFTHLASYGLTLITNTITWAGIKYQLTFSGDVARIERPGDDAR